MTDKEFERVAQLLFDQANKTLLNRRDAYATDDDRLANFKQTGEATGLTPEKVCETYLYKALSSMLKILHGKPAIGETVLERFADPFNYIILAFALWAEKHPEQLPATKEELPKKSIEDYLEAFRASQKVHPSWKDLTQKRDPLRGYAIPLLASNRFVD